MGYTPKQNYDEAVARIKSGVAFSGDQALVDKWESNISEPEAATTTPEVTTPGTVSMTPGLNELIEEIEAGGGKIPDDVMDIIEPILNPTEKYGIPFLKTKFGELDPEKQGKKLSDKWFDLYNTYGMEPDDPNIREIMRYLTRMRGVAESGKQISSSQYLMNQQKNLNPWMNMPGVQVASMGNLTGMGIPNALQQQQQQAELMQAGNLALNQTPDEVATQIAASQGQGNFLGYTPNPGNVQAPTMTQQQMVEEAIQTGGTVNPHEATQAVYAPSRPSRPVRGPHGKARGGVISLQDLLNRRV